MSIYRAVAARRGRMGDPFIGALVGGLARRVVPGLGKLAAKALGAITGRTAARAATAITVGVAARDVVKTALPQLPVPQWVGGGRGFDLLPAEAGGGRPWPRNKDGTPRRMRRDGKPWKRPSMNFMNGRAVKRAARRLEGAEKLLRRVFSIRHGGSAGRITPKGKGKR